MEHTYTVVFRREAAGRYTVLVPALPGCLTGGASLREAMTMAKDAISCHLTSLLQDGGDPPQDVETVAFERNVMRGALVLPVTIGSPGATG